MNATADRAGSRNVLLVAYHFPPDASSTGRLRTLGFARHLPACNWRAFVLSAHARAYERTDPNGVADIPADTEAYRAFALDTRRHLSWRGKYVAWLAVPDRWIWWWPAAVRQGLQVIRRQRVAALWSTYPIATTHLVAITLASRTGLPWIADFRDPVVPSGSALQKRAASWIEKRTLARADRILFTTPSARALYARRFPSAADRMVVVPNGYEDALFAALDDRQRPGRSRLKFVHSGLLYSQGRNPRAFFQALSALKKKGVVTAARLEVVLRASGHEAEYEQQLKDLDIADLVELAAPIAYREALKEQADADGLLLFQGSEFNAQIPAKVYEYLRIGRPIVALTDPTGDTAELLEKTGGAVIAPMEEAGAIADALAGVLQQVQSQTFAHADRDVVRSYSRLAATQQLAQLLEEITTTDEEPDRTRLT